MSAATPRPTVGVLPPIYVPSGVGPADPLRADAGYFLVRIHSAQAAYRGRFWDNIRNTVRHVVVTSQVTLRRRQADEGFQHLQARRPIRPGEAVQLGLRPNLVDLIPTTVEPVSVKLSLLLDRQDRLADLAAGINGSGFLSAISLAEPTLAAAKAFAGVTKTVLDAFLPAAAQTQVLEFAGDFNVGANDLRPGYYVILGTPDADPPLPLNPHLEVKGPNLLVDGGPASAWSYVILEVIAAPVRGINPDAEWYKLLQEAENLADAFANGFDKGADQQTQAQRRCHELIVGAQALLRADPSYHQAERRAIAAAAFKRCRDTIIGATTGGLESAGKSWDLLDPWIDETSNLLQLAPDAVDGEAAGYAQDVQATGKLLQYRAERDKEAETLAAEL